MSNPIIKYTGKQEQNIQADLLYSILQATGGGSGGGTDVSALNKEVTQLLIKTVSEDILNQSQQINSQMANNISVLLAEIEAIRANTVTMQSANSSENTNLINQLVAVNNNVAFLTTSNTNENALIAKQTTLVQVANHLQELRNLQVINKYAVLNIVQPISQSTGNSANTYFGSRRKMTLRVVSGSVTVSIASPAINIEFYKIDNNNNSNTTLGVGVWVCDTVPDAFTVNGVGANCELVLYP